MKMYKAGGKRARAELVIKTCSRYSGMGKELMTQYLVALVAQLLLSSLTCAQDCVMMRTTTCPQTKQQWDIWEKEFNCAVPTYVCILTENNTLVQTCMYNYKVGSNQAGCPYIQTCGDPGPLLGVSEAFSKCDPDIPGCPPINHSGYTLSQLYKYPACFLPENKRTRDWMRTSTTVKKGCTTTPMVVMVNTDKKDTGWNSGGDLKQFIILVIVLAVGILAAVLACGLIILHTMHKTHAKYKNTDSEKALRDQTKPYANGKCSRGSKDQTDGEIEPLNNKV